MKAMVMTGFGGSEVLSYQDIDTPELGPDEVLVEVLRSLGQPHLRYLSPRRHLRPPARAAACPRR